MGTAVYIVKGGVDAIHALARDSRRDNDAV